MISSKSSPILLTILAWSFLATGPLSAHHSRNTMTFQGRLTDATAAPITGTHEFILRVYPSEGAAVGSELFFDRHATVTVNIGIYEILIGTGLDAGGASNDGIPDSVFNNDELWLGLEVDGDGEMTPRTRLSSGSFAFRSRTADKLEGLDPSQFLRADTNGTVTGNVTITGSITGDNITSGTDPGHTHTGGSLTEADTLDDVAGRGNSTTEDLRIGSAGTPTHTLDVDGDADVTGDLDVSGTITGGNVTGGVDPGHTHTGGSLTEADTLDDVAGRGNSTAVDLRVGSVGTPTHTLDIDGDGSISGDLTVEGGLSGGADGILGVTSNVTVDGTLSATGAISGINVTSGTDPGHSHSGGSVTESDTLQSVTDRGVSTTNSIRIGGSSAPVHTLDVEGSADFTGLVTMGSNLTVTGAIIGDGVTAGLNPGHTHSGDDIEESDTLDDVVNRGGGQAGSTAHGIRIGSVGTVNDTLQVDGTTLLTGNVTVSADLLTTGNITGTNVTSGVDPGHTHSPASITEADTLDTVVGRGATTASSIRIGATAAPTSTLNVDGDLAVTSDVTLSSGLTVSGAITGPNVTGGADPGHTHGSTSITESQDLDDVVTLGNSTASSVRIGGSSAPTSTLNVEGDLDVTSDVTFGADLTVTGAITGPNVTSGSDPGHTHTGGSLTEAQTLDDVVTLGPSTSQSVRIGGSSAPTSTLNVEGDLDVTSDVTFAADLTVSGSVVGGNVTSGTDPGHVHTGATLTESQDIDDVLANGNSTTRSLRLGTVGTPSDTLDVNGTANITAGVTVTGNVRVGGEIASVAGDIVATSGDIIATGGDFVAVSGQITGVNVTSGTDPGHTHTGASVTETQDLDDVTTNGASTTNAVRIGGSSAPANTLNVDGDAVVTESVTLTSSLDVSGPSTFSGPATFNSSTFSGGPLTVDDSASIQGSLTGGSDGNLDITDNTTIAGTLGVSGAISGINVTSGADPGHTHTGLTVTETQDIDDVLALGNSSSLSMRLGSTGTPTDVLDIDGTANFSGAVSYGSLTGGTVSGTTITGTSFSGPNVTSGSDPGHTHTASSITESQDLDAVLALGNSSTTSIRIGTSGTPSDPLDVDGSANISGTVTFGTLTGGAITGTTITGNSIVGPNVTSGTDPGHTHTDGALNSATRTQITTVTFSNSSYATISGESGIAFTTTEVADVQVFCTFVVEDDDVVDDHCEFRLIIDGLTILNGATQAYVHIPSTASTTRQAVNIMFTATSLSAGSHTFNIQARSPNSNSFTLLGETFVISTVQH